MSNCVISSQTGLAIFAMSSSQDALQSAHTTPMPLAAYKHRQVSWCYVFPADCEISSPHSYQVLHRYRPNTIRNSEKTNLGSTRNELRSSFSLRTLKKKLILPLVQTLPLFQGAYTVGNDAYDQETRFILLQKQPKRHTKPIGYWSLSLTKDEHLTSQPTQNVLLSCGQCCYSTHSLMVKGTVLLLAGVM